MDLGTVVTRGPDVAEPDQSAAGAPNGLGDWPDPSPRRAEPFQAVEGRTQMEVRSVTALHSYDGGFSDYASQRLRSRETP